MKNNNRAAVQKLARRSFKANRQRNAIAVGAIALTTVLFTALFTLGLGAVDMFQKSTMRQVGTSAHAGLKYITAEQYEAVKNHNLVAQIGHGVVVADSVENEELLKRHGEIWWRDTDSMALTFTTPTAGRAPEAADEIAADTMALELLGVELRENAEVTLLLNVKGVEVERTFRLVGWWEPDPAFSVSQFTVGAGYLAAYAQELENEYYTTGWYAGAHFAEVMFRNTTDLQGKLGRIITESGYRVAGGGIDAGEGAIYGNINWGYISSGGADIGMVAAGVVALLLIMATGYLIIYNIFGISVLRDIRFYGLLKTIGATGRQIKSILRTSALWLCLMGIPLGMLLGYFVGAALLPLVMQTSTFAQSGAQMTPSVWMFVLSGAFALATVMLSVAKPGRMAAAVSPIEAVRYSDSTGKVRKKVKKSTDGGKLWRMAFSNLGRNKRRTVLVLLSLSFSLVLLNTVFTVSGGLDLEKYVSRQTDVDFMVSHAAKLNFDYTGANEALDEGMIEDLQDVPGFLHGGRIYFSLDDLGSVGEPEEYEEGRFSYTTAAMMGMDDWVLQTLNVVDGELDLEKLKTGGYVVQGIHVDDRGNARVPYAVGDVVEVAPMRQNADGDYLPYGESRSYTVLATAELNVITHTDGYSWDNFFLLPSEVYIETAVNPAVMLYRFEVEDGFEEAAEEWLAEYTAEVQPLLTYVSRASAMAEFEGAVKLVVLVGGVLSGVIGVIGILNFINSILTSIIARRQEFAVLESIGMTRRQLRRMLCCEGLVYAVATILLSLLGAVLLSLLVGGALADGLWFYSYRFVLGPLFVCWPVLLALAVLVPVVCLAGSARESVILRLRTAE